MAWLTPELLSSITALLAALAAVLAWAAKLWWGKEYADAKDEIIKAKDAQIAVLEREVKSLSELTPMKLREYFVSVKEQLEEYNNTLHEQLKEAKIDLQRADEQVKLLTTQGEATSGELARLQLERDELRTVVASLETQQQNIESQQKKLNGQEHTLTARQRNIYTYIQQFMQKYGYPPAIRNIQNDLNISSTSIVAYNLRKLEEHGLLVRDPRFARGMKLPFVDEDQKSDS
jgi:DNA repair exonuclease SbcCD ATPase subunit